MPPPAQPTRVGKYELEEFLGGGMSHVYRAKDSVLGRRVALKILTEAGMADTEAKARFLQEARTASNISHENIISVYDFGEDQGRPFMVMELLEGESLRQAIKRGHLGDFTQRMKILLQVARAIDHIHAKRIIHRDIKPENIHLDAAGKVTLMDFGIAKSEGIALTRAGFTLGTPYYMAPEQVLGQQLTPQADVYAFGILVFEVLTGMKPISGESVEKIFNQILYEPVNLEPLRALNHPQQVSDLVARCTAKQPVQRPQGLGFVIAELERIIDPARPVPRSGPRPVAPFSGSDPNLVDPTMIPTVTAVANTPEQQRAALQQTGAAQRSAGKKSKSPFNRSLVQMLLSCALVVAVMTLIYFILTAAHVI